MDETTAAFSRSVETVDGHDVPTWLGGANAAAELNRVENNSVVVFIFEWDRDHLVDGGMGMLWNGLCRLVLL